MQDMCTIPANTSIDTLHENIPYSGNFFGGGGGDKFVAEGKFSKVGTLYHTSYYVQFFMGKIFVALIWSAKTTKIIPLKISRYTVCIHVGSGCGLS